SRHPRSTLLASSAASDVYNIQIITRQQWLEMQAYSANGEFTADNTEQMSFEQAPPINDDPDFYFKEENFVEE
ncbi:MAG: hypothetical protein K2H13_09325, partial [Eubacterium sp.]|nr:hypothetical protein [Eubacterium sp.]